MYHHILPFLLLQTHILAQKASPHVVFFPAANDILAVGRIYRIQWEPITNNGNGNGNVGFLLSAIIDPVTGESKRVRNLSNSSGVPDTGFWDWTPTQSDLDAATLDIGLYDIEISDVKNASAESISSGDFKIRNDTFVSGDFGAGSSASEGISSSSEAARVSGSETASASASETTNPSTSETTNSSASGTTNPPETTSTSQTTSPTETAANRNSSSNPNTTPTAAIIGGTLGGVGIICITIIIIFCMRSRGSFTFPFHRKHPDAPQLPPGHGNVAFAQAAVAELGNDAFIVSPEEATAELPANQVHELSGQRAVENMAYLPKQETAENTTELKGTLEVGGHETVKKGDTYETEVVR